MTGTGRAYVVGAGLSGLSTAVALASSGRQVTLFEAAPQAGGRCRSYFDATLGQIIDNGNHFVLSGNRATMKYLRLIGSERGLEGPDKARTSFVDIRDGMRWTIAPNDTALPLWLFDARARVPGTTPRDYLEIARLLTAGPDRTIAETLSCDGPLWERLLRPFFLGALNTQPETASAKLAGALVRETFAKGGRAYRTRIAHPTLAAVFVDPALGFLARHGADVRLGERLRRIVVDDAPVALEFQGTTVPLTREDAIVLATPPWVAAELLPGISAPDEFSAIVNAHFRTVAPQGTPGMLGVIGGTAEWIFSFADRVSVTISAADRLIDIDREELARTIWLDVCAAHGRHADMPAWQIVKERRATFRATPDQARRRAEAKTRWRGVFLAGDWTATGLPATIEGALRSAETAADLAARHLRH